MYNFTRLSFSVAIKLYVSLCLLLFFVQISFAATYYSDPSSASVTITGTGANGASGWSTTATGTFGTVTFATGDHIVIQSGSTVTITGSGQTIGNITFGTGTLGDGASTLIGGKLVIGFSSLNCSGNIVGSGELSNATSNTSRISMTGTNKNLNVTLTGNAGLTVGNASVTSNTILLSGNTVVGGRITIGSGASAANKLELNGNNLSIDFLTVASTSCYLKATTGAEEVTISGVTGLSSASIIQMDQTNATTSTLGKLTLNNAGGVTVKTIARVGNLVLTNGKLFLQNGDLTVTNSISGGSSTSYVVTNNNNRTFTGNLVVNVGAGVRTFIPIGTITLSSLTSTSYDAVAVTPTNATAFTIQVRNVLNDSASLANRPSVTFREWNIASSSPSSTLLELTPNYPTPSDNTTPNPVIGHFVSSTWEEIAATRSGNTFTATVTSFSPFAVGTAGGFVVTLPVQLTQFYATPKAHAVSLHWTTASEKDNAVFQIEHSVNGKDFKAIGAVNGSGSSAQTISYSFEHTAPAEGVNYYRLKQIDLDGYINYSSIKTAIIGNASFVLKSNLVTNALDIITSTKAPVAFGIFSTSGQRMINDFAQGEKLVDISRLPAGLYFIKVADGQVARFVKQ